MIQKSLAANQNISTLNDFEMGGRQIFRAHAHADDGNRFHGKVLFGNAASKILDFRIAILDLMFESIAGHSVLQFQSAIQIPKLKIKETPCENEFIP